jgi:hypothetical protein
MARNPKRWNNSKGTVEAATAVFTEEYATVYFFDVGFGL